MDGLEGESSPTAAEEELGVTFFKSILTTVACCSGKYCCALVAYRAAVEPSLVLH